MIYPYNQAPFPVLTEEGSSQVELLELFEVFVGDRVSIPRAGIEDAYVMQVQKKTDNRVCILIYGQYGKKATMTGCYALYKHPVAPLCELDPARFNELMREAALYQPSKEEEFHRALGRFKKDIKRYVHPDYPIYKLSKGVCFLISQGFDWIIEDMLADAKKQKPGLEDMLIFRWDHPSISIFDGEANLVLRKTIEHPPQPFVLSLKLWFLEHTLLLSNEY